MKIVEFYNKLAGFCEHIWFLGGIDGPLGVSITVIHLQQRAILGAALHCFRQCLFESPELTFVTCKWVIIADNALLEELTALAVAAPHCAIELTGSNVQLCQSILRH